MSEAKIEMFERMDDGSYLNLALARRIYYGKGLAGEIQVIVTFEEGLRGKHLLWFTIERLEDAKERVATILEAHRARFKTEYRIENTVNLPEEKPRKKRIEVTRDEDGFLTEAEILEVSLEE